MAAANEKKKRSTVPVKPENSALADELRHRLKGKPTAAGFRAAGSAKQEHLSGTA